MRVKSRWDDVEYDIKCCMNLPPADRLRATYCYYCEVGPVGVNSVRYSAVGCSALEATARALGHVLDSDARLDWLTIPDCYLPEYTESRLPFLREDTEG